MSLISFSMVYISDWLHFRLPIADFSLPLSNEVPLFNCYCDSPWTPIGNRHSAMTSFISKRHQRIDLRSAPSGDATRNESNQRQQRCNCKKCCRIFCGHLEQ